MTTRRRQSSPWLRAVPIVLGLLGVGAGLGLAALYGSFMWVHYALLGLSAASIAGGLLWLQEVRWRQTFITLVYTFFFILSVVFVYLISANRRISWDLTEQNIHTLSPQTQAVIKSIPADRQIVAHVFAPAAEHQLMTRFLNAYGDESPRFDYHLHDPDRDLDVVDRFGGNVDKNSVYMIVKNANGDAIRRSPPVNIGIGDVRRENKMSNLIARTIVSNDQRFYYVMGHGERRVAQDEPESLTKMVNMIRRASLEVEQLRLSEGRIPSNAEALIMARPNTDLLDFEKELLINYLDNGGKLFLMLDPQPGKERYLPNLQEVLNHVGLSIPNRFIVAPESVAARGSSFTPLVRWAEHPITKGSRKTPFYLVEARPVQDIGELPDGVNLKGVLATGAKTWTEPADDLRSMRRLQPPEAQNAVGVKVAAVSARKETPGGRYGNEMRLVAIGDSDGFTDKLLERNGEAGVFALQTMNWLREREDLLRVPPRIMSSTPVTLTTQRVWAILGSFVFIGLLITIGGTARTLMRRRSR